MESFIKAPYLSVGLQREKLYVGFGSIQKVIKDKTMHSIVIKTLAKFKKANTWRAVSAELGDDELFNSAKDFIVSNNFLMPAGSYNSEDRFSRSQLYFNMLGGNYSEIHERLTSSKVGIIGCGGIGNLVSVNLATAGVKKFVLADEDHVELSNLSRQIMFKEDSIGKSKVECLSESLKERASYCEIKQVPKRVKTEQDMSAMKDCNLLVVSADDRNIVKLVNTFSMKYKIPFINVGYVNDIAVWGPFVIPGETGCFACQDIIAGKGEDEELSLLIAEINKGYQAPSVSPVCMLSSSLATLDIIRYLAGNGEINSKNKRIGLWTNDMKFEEQDCSKNPSCRVCS